MQGKVVYEDGSPATNLAGYTVSFDCPAQKVSASGLIDSDGSFRVGTFEEGDGAMPGTHHVAITPPEAPVDGPPLPRLLDKKYGDMGTSGLEVEIKPGRNEVTLKVERAKR